MKKIVVAGNATLDVFISEKPQIEDGNVNFESRKGELVEFIINNPPTTLKGKKVRVEQNLAQDVRPLTHRYEPGGGGYNSIISMRQIMGIGEQLDLMYIDVSIPDSLVMNKLRNLNIDSRFLFQREIPVNLVIGYREDKLILKGPQLGRVSPTEIHLQALEKAIIQSDSFLANSIKDPLYMEQYLKLAEQHNIPFYVVITASLERDFVFKRVLPKVSPLLNYDDLPELLGEGSNLEVRERMELARDAMLKIRKERINPDKPVIITLGENGAYVAKKSAFYHIKARGDYSRRISKSINNVPEGVSGAGDYFAGALVAHDTAAKQKEDLVMLVIKASKAAIRHIGYKGRLPHSAFEVIEYKI